MSAPAETPRAEREHFAEFFRTSYRPLLRRLVLLGASMAEAEDAISAAMLSTLTNWERIAEPTAYVSLAASREFINSRVREQRRRALTDRMRSREEDDGSALTAVDDGLYVPEVLRSLPPRQRAVFALLLDGFSLSEIAADMGVAPEAVRSSLYKARLALKHQLLERQQREKEMDDVVPRG